MKSAKPYISLPRGAEMLGVSVDTFKKIVAEERFEVIRPRVQRRVSLSDVLGYRERLRYRERHGERKELRPYERIV